MLIMVSNATGIEVGILAMQYPGRIGHLFSPGGERGPWRELPFALDNGAWIAFKKPLRTVLRSWDWRALLRDQRIPDEAVLPMLRAFAHVEAAENAAAKNEAAKPKEADRG